MVQCTVTETQFYVTVTLGCHDSGSRDVEATAKKNPTVLDFVSPYDCVGEIGIGNNAIARFEMKLITFKV